MTMREVCGLTTEEIARAFLTKPATIAQRIVRAKGKIRDARIPSEVPPQEELPGRLDAVLRVVYLVFNEGYSASSGDALTRHDLSGEAIRLARVLVQLLPDPEAIGLLALLLLQDSRRDARASESGDVDSVRGPGSNAVESGPNRRGDGASCSGRCRWEKWVPTAFNRPSPQPMPKRRLLPPRIGGRIVGLYDLLLQAEPSPDELNRAGSRHA
ncbi:MAG: DUF6596 domain-containing protein [Nitrospiraceae bacterium]